MRGMGSRAVSRVVTMSRVFVVAVLPAALLFSVASPATAAPPVRAEAVAQQAPVIDNIIPSTGFLGIPVAIRGSHFGVIQVPLLSKVTFNGVDAGQAISWTDDYIVAVVPAEAVTGPVVVTTIFGDSNPYAFTVYEQPNTYSCYFAEGTTRAGFEEWLTLYNPWDVEYVATVTYLVANGANRIRYYNVPAHTRMNIYVNSEIGSDMDVSITVTSLARLYAERPMYFRYKNMWSGGHDTVPALETGNTWYFAEGTTRAGFEEWLCLANPGDTEANVSLKYAFQNGGTQDQSLVLAPGRRLSIFVNEVVGTEKDVAVRVNSDQGIVAERSMYFLYHDAWDGGTNALGFLSSE